MHNNQGVLDLNIRKLAVPLFIDVLWWDIFESLYLYNLFWFLCLFILLKKKSEISIIIKPVFTISLFITSNLKKSLAKDVALWRSTT